MLTSEIDNKDVQVAYADNCMILAEPMSVALGTTVTAGFFSIFPLSGNIADATTLYNKLSITVRSRFTNTGVTVTKSSTDNDKYLTVSLTFNTSSVGADEMKVLLYRSSVLLAEFKGLFVSGGPTAAPAITLTTIPQPDGYILAAVISDFRPSNSLTVTWKINGAVNLNGTSLSSVMYKSSNNTFSTVAYKRVTFATYEAATTINVQVTHQGKTIEKFFKQ